MAWDPSAIGVVSRPEVDFLGFSGLLRRGPRMACGWVWGPLCLTLLGEHSCTGEEGGDSVAFAGGDRLVWWGAPAGGAGLGAVSCVWDHLQWGTA